MHILPEVTALSVRCDQIIKKAERLNMAQTDRVTTDLQAFRVL